MKRELKYLEKITKKGLISYSASLSKIWVILLFSSLQHIISVSLPFLFMFIITHLWFVSSTFIYLEFCVGFIIISGIWSTCSYVKDKLFYNLLFEHNYNISSEAISLLTSLPYSSTGNLPVESQFCRFVPLENLADIWFEKVIRPFSDMPLVFFAFGVICYFLGFVYFVYMTCVILLVLFIMNYKTSDEHQSVTESEFLGTINDTYSNLNLINSHNRKDFFINKNKELIRKRYNAKFITNTKNTIISNINESILLLIYIGSLGFAVYNTLMGDISTKYLVAIIILTWFSISPLKQILSINTDIKRSKDLLQQFSNLMRVDQSRNRHKKMKLDDSFQGNIILNNINFSYPNGSKFVMSNINLAAKRGRVLFLYGLSGSGKSTIFKLISGLIKQASGTITIDYDTTLLDSQSLSERILYISDDAFFNNTTINNNLDMSYENMTEIDYSDFLHNLNIDPNSNQNIVNNYDLKEFQKLESKKIPYRKIINNILVSKIPSDVKNKIILLDEPLFEADQDSYEFLAKKIHQIKDNNTVIIASRHDIYATLADDIILLNDGRLEKKWTKHDK